ncbi:fibronectin type III and SPRY domain-containing protein 2 [Carcharodon carcharias]|uniref:fibronectin type III and SPRY domain-containing protein 2 n=1 Tax=Carcharodon carcharias TaxID=13397 RepID=UPI001B7DD23F|nr:fibronectin type III and SPRY domain-containing protein 2 [Carcharodon carcharias]
MKEPQILTHSDNLAQTDRLSQEEPLPEVPRKAEDAPGEGIPASEAAGSLGSEEAAGFQFYHADLYEPGQRLEVFTDKPEAPRASDPGVHTHSGSSPAQISAQSPIDLEFPTGELATGGNLMDFSSFFTGNEFDPFQQIVDCSDSASLCNDPLLSPVSDRMEECEAAGTGHHVSEGGRDPAALLTKDIPSETGYEVDSWEISDDTIPDVYCQSCKTPIPAFEKLFGSHKHHRVAPLALAAEATKLECQNNLKKLEQQLIELDTFVNHLEEISVTVEENIGKQEHYLELQYDDLMQFLVERYEDRSQELEGEKSQKLEELYGKLLSCGQSADLYKELLESTEELFKTEDKQIFLKNGQTALARLEEFLQVDFNPELTTTTEFETFPTDMPEVQRLIDTISSIPVPSAPLMCPQTPGTATANSVRVRWSLSADDTVEHYQLYYRQLPADSTQQDQAPADTSLKVKEMYHTVRNLRPDTAYEFWVTATNSAGTSVESDRLKHTTVPLAPTIKRRAVAICQDAILIEWEPGSGNPANSYTVEFCQVCRGCNWRESLTESLTGITSCKTLIELEANENYLFYVRAVNEGGCSERSSPINIRTTGTQFYLIEQTAHLALSILEDGLTIVHNEESVFIEPADYDDRFTSCAAVMGQLVPIRGKHYWEVEVTEHTEYRIGVASPNIPRESYLGSNITSWCMRHTLTPSRSKFEFLHNGITPDLRITVPPKRIGILLDYDTGKLSFFNPDIPQHLFTFSQQFQNLVNPCFALESSGILKISHGIPIPEFTK